MFIWRQLIKSNRETFLKSYALCHVISIYVWTPANKLNSIQMFICPKTVIRAYMHQRPLAVFDTIGFSYGIFSQKGHQNLAIGYRIS